MRFFYRSSGPLASIMIISFVSLFESYLSDRTQYVNIDGCHSTLRDANLRVAQGSILGPVLFLILVNDLQKILEHSAADI